MSLQCCAICAWRENCAKKFCVADGGAHCPDYAKDVTIRDREPEPEGEKSQPDDREVQ